MMNSFLLLLTVASTIVLRSGDRIAVEGPVRTADGVVTFRSAGLLYSVPESEVEQIQKRDTGSGDTGVRRLRVSEEERKRLIAELEKNHSGKPAPRPRQQAQKSSTLEVTPEPQETREDEAWWRSQARAHEENVRRAQDELQLLEARAQELNDQILSFISLGYHPRQFTYQSTQLELTRERIPYARLELKSAERVWEQFREDARRAGILPGWLR
jgi:hypothetical protein